jgi:hypothetical protein
MCGFAGATTITTEDGRPQPSALRNPDFARPGDGAGASRSWIFQLTRYNDFLRAELSTFEISAMQLKQTS